MVFLRDGDLVEFNTVEFGSLLPDCLEALQHVGKTPAPILLGSVLGEPRGQSLLDVPLQVIGQHTQKHVAADAPIQLVVGGVRVPGIVEWPARIAKPFVSETPCSTLDIYPTLLEATGTVAKNQIQPLDGVSLLPVFDRKTESRAKAIPFWNHAGKQPGHAALLDWPYKLHTDAITGRDKKGRKGGEVTPVLLYDVSKDPKETTDLAAQQPERVAKMTAALEARKASVERSLAGGDYAPTPRK